ncbi:hypothetical protein ABFY60_27785 [Lysinibacillus pakistanensis]|uniref:hypothetical protein n=1 Tax=Lysinibacillus pakistanensis TaxID=759811 RepID=UPI003D28F83A
MEETLFSLQQYKMTKQKDETLQKIQKQKLAQYQSDFKQFRVFCDEHLLKLDLNR